jgi:S1-C subfamily serine protease
LLLPLLLIGAAIAPGHAATLDGHALASRVLKIVVTRADGSRELGSAVSLAGDQLVTNCHVISDASRIEIELAGETRLATSDLRDSYRDLCFLNLPGYQADPVPMIDVGETRVGLDVAAAGYTNGVFNVSSGRIIGLHTCECDGGKVIQTSAPFDRGASGGGLFDRAGRLIGILTFKAKNGGNFHFALPVGWVRQMADQRMDSASQSQNESFWKRPGKESGYFLAACDLGEKKAWRALSGLAAEWIEQEPNNPESWMALGRAHRGLGQTDAAVADFQQALMLDSTHVEAQWALQELEVELGRDLIDSDKL